MTEAEIDKETKRVGGRRCKQCGHTGFYPDKEYMSRQPCRCDGGLLGRTGSIPHRVGSACCIYRPFSELHRMRRAGASEDEIQDRFVEMLWDGEGGRVGGPCPF